MLDINEYIYNTRTTFARFAFSLGIRTLLHDTFEYMPYLMENADEANQRMESMLKSSIPDFVIAAQKFLDEIKSNQKFVLEDKTLNLSDFYAEWEDMLGWDLDNN